MTTATVIPQHPSSILPNAVHRRGPTILKRPRYNHEIKKKAPTTAKPVLLRNLRNYYARRRPSMSISNKAPKEEPNNRKVQFFPRVRVKRIPSRMSYSEDDRLSLWVPKKELKQMVIRNHAEFAFEGQDWQKAPEEDDFGQRNGKLVHPFYVWAEQEDGNETDQSVQEDDDEEDTAESAETVASD